MSFKIYWNSILFYNAEKKKKTNEDCRRKPKAAKARKHFFSSVQMCIEKAEIVVSRASHVQVHCTLYTVYRIVCVQCDGDYVKKKLKQMDRSNCQPKKKRLQIKQEIKMKKHFAQYAEWSKYVEWKEMHTMLWGRGGKARRVVCHIRYYSLYKRRTIYFR